MRLLVLTVWSLCCVGAGALLASHRAATQAPLDKAERLYRQEAQPALEAMTEHAQDAVDAIKRKTMNDPAPKERHSAADRTAVDALIAKRGQK